MFSANINSQPYKSFQRKSLFSDLIYEDNQPNNSKIITNSINQYNKGQKMHFPKLSPSQILKGKFAKFNNDLLLPRCLQKTLKKKFNLSPVSQKIQKSQSLFKLKNYCKLPDLQFDAPKQNLEYQVYQNQFQERQSISQNSSMRLTFLQQSFLNHNQSFQHQLSNMLVTQSKIKYRPKQTMQDSKNKWSKFNKNENQINQPKNLNRTSSMLNFSSLSPQKKTIRQWKEPQELLNSTRTKLLFRANKIHKQKVTKTDLFPLEKLLQDRKNKINFRSKLFQNKIMQNGIRS